ncbi:MAG: hypothetical protein KKE44_01440, partial [Proteobacteria bacterium]|nr:hypothetical protein [Pseudomonadota bacterium]MBU1581391.1 hypothetical protein [Pseudomonadota bacterium]
MSEKPDSSTYADKRMTAGSIQKAVIDTREKGLYHSAVLDKGIDHDKETGSRKLNRVDRIVKKMIISLDVEKKSITGILKHDLLGMKGEVYAARSALSHMRSARPALSNDEVMKILLILKDKHRLGEFLLLSGEPDIMKYLANKNVSRIFIIENWELTWDDILAFMSGFVAGAVSDWVEGWYALAQMIGSAYMKGVAAQFEATKAVLTADKKKIIEIVDDMHQFWLAIGMMWEQINLNPIKGYENWSKQVDEAFIHLDFKTAGRLYGELLIAIIDMASIVFAFASGAGKLSKKIVKHIPKKTIVRMLYNIKNIKLLSYNELLKLLSPINVKDLRNALKKLDEYMSVEGFQFGGLVPCYAQATAGTAGQGAIGFYVTIVNRTKKEVIFLSSKTYDTIGKQLMSILDDFMDDIEVFGKTYGDLSVPK